MDRLVQPSWSSGFAPIAFVLVTGDILTTSTAIAAIEEYGSHRVRLFSVDTGRNDEVLDSYVHYFLPEALQVPVETARLDFEPALRTICARVEKSWRDLQIPSRFRRYILTHMKPTGVPFVDLALCTARIAGLDQTVEQLTEACLDATAFQATMEGILVEIWKPITSSAHACSIATTPAMEKMVSHQLSSGREIFWRVRDPLHGWTEQQRLTYLASHGIPPVTSAPEFGNIGGDHGRDAILTAAIAQLQSRNERLTFILEDFLFASAPFSSIETELIAAIENFARTDEIGIGTPLKRRRQFDQRQRLGAAHKLGLANAGG